MPVDHVIYFLLLTLLAEILGTVGGFGSSLFFVPIASLFLDFHSVLGITAIFHVCSNLTKLYIFKDGADKHLILWIGVPAILLVAIGAYFSKFMDARILELSLAILLISLSLLFLIFPQIIVPATNVNAVVGGGLSGFFAGFLGTGGAIRGISLSAFDLRPAVFVTTSAIIDLGIDSTRTVVYLFNGYVHWHDLYLLIPLFVASIAGTQIGKRILHLLSDRQFKVIVLIFVFLTGVLTIVNAYFGISFF